MKIFVVLDVINVEIVVGMEIMNKIMDRIYVGDRQDAIDLMVTNPNNIGAILNVCETQDPPLDVVSLYMPFADCAPIPEYEFRACMQWLQDQYVRFDRNIFIHCHLGISRSPTICAAFMAQNKLAENIDIAVSIIRAVRPIVWPHQLTLESAKRYLENV